jgi:hypothetical protein
MTLRTSASTQQWIFFHSLKMLLTPRNLRRVDDHDRLQTIALLAHTSFSASVVIAIDNLHSNFVLRIMYFVSTLRTSYFVLTLHTLGLVNLVNTVLWICHVLGHVNLVNESDFPAGFFSFIGGSKIRCFHKRFTEHGTISNGALQCKKGTSTNGALLWEPLP